MQPVTRARILGGIAGTAGTGLLVAGHWGPGLGLLSAGAATVLLVTERGVPEGLPDRASGGPLRALGSLARGLHLEGRGIVLPGRGPPEPSRVFIPARDAGVGDLPTLRDDVVVYRGGAGAAGVLLPAPGAGLEAAWREARGLPQGRGPEEAALHVREALPALSLGRDVVIARSGTLVRVAYVPLEFRESCRASREEQAPWHLQGGCPACSFTATLVSRAHGRPVRVVAAGAEGERVFLDLEVGG